MTRTGFSHLTVVRPDRRRQHRIARRMYACGLPPWVIRLTLRISARRLAPVLNGSDLWSADFADLIKAEHARVA